jgi:hypothetical protein
MEMLFARTEGIYGSHNPNIAAMHHCIIMAQFLCFESQKE